MVDLQLTPATTLFSDESLSVVEFGSSAVAADDSQIQVGATEFIRRMRERLSLAPDATVRFKVFGIDRDGEHLRTRQRLIAGGTRDGDEILSHGVVDATWVIPAGDDELPVLSRFMISSLIQGRRDSAAPAMFEDITPSILGHTPCWGEQLQLGMNTWRSRIDHSLNPDFLGYHGLAIRDVDGDGLEDLYLCQAGGLPNLLLQQQADGTLIDISAAAGVDWLDNSTGSILVDLDNDGDSDLVLATQSALLVMANDGAGKFDLRARYPGVGFGYSPTAADYDLDGDLDILVLRYAGEAAEIGSFPTPHPFHDARNGGANVLLENRGSFQFVDVTEQTGLGGENHRFSFAASWEDYDNDGDTDLYVANDFGPNQLFRNDAKTFTDVSVESGTQDWGFGMSATWADYNRDGQMDLYVSSMFSGAGSQVVPQADFNPSMPEETRRKYLKMVRGNSLMRNLGGGKFADVTDPSAEGFAGWAWGSTFADFNNDGWEDLYVANGYISQPDKDDL
ncbi:MAG: FG-GAP repeat domain-containing protein [Verrucomicrobiales bacterium]